MFATVSEMQNQRSQINKLPEPLTVNVEGATGAITPYVRSWLWRSPIVGNVHGSIHVDSYTSFADVTDIPGEDRKRIRKDTRAWKRSAANEE